MKPLLPLIICCFIFSDVAAQRLLNVYSIGDNPEWSIRVEHTRNTADGGMLLSGRLQARDVWMGNHVTRVDIDGQPVWSAFVRGGVRSAGVFETAGGGAALLRSNWAGREEMLLFSPDGTLTDWLEYRFEERDGRLGKMWLESLSQNEAGELVITVLGSREGSRFAGGTVRVNAANGSLLEESFWGVAGMRHPIRIVPGTADVIFAAGHAQDNRDGVVGALTVDGDLLRQWRLLKTMGEYGEHHQIGRKLFLLEHPEADRSIHMMLLDADQDSLSWSVRIPLPEIANARNWLAGQMVPKFAGGDENHIYLWMEPVAPATKAPQLATFSIHDGSLISVEQQASGISSPDVLNNIAVRAGSSTDGVRRFFSFSRETGSTTFQQGNTAAEDDCPGVLELTGDFTPVEPITVRQAASNLTTVPVDLIVTVTAKSLAELRPRRLVLDVREVCRTPEEEEEEAVLASISIYPNPTTSLLRVEITTPEPAEAMVDLQLHDLHGRRILVEREDMGDGLTLVSLDDLPSGVYLVTVIVAGGRFTERIIKQ